MHALPGLLVQESVGLLRNPLTQSSGGRGPSGRSPLGGRGPPISKGAQARGLENLWGKDDGGRGHADGDGGGDGDVGRHHSWRQRRGYNRRWRQYWWGLGYRGHHVDWTLWFGSDERWRYFDRG